MSAQRTRRRLAAIMSVDVAGFSRLMGSDEDGTLSTLKRLQKTIVSPRVTERDGRIVSRLGWLEVYADRPEAAFQHFEHALRLSPLDPMNFNNWVGIASAHLVSGDYGAAADLFQRALMERPSAFWIHRNLAPALLAAGRIEEAEVSRKKMLEAYPTMSIQRFKRAMVFSQRVLDDTAIYLRKLGVPEGDDQVSDPTA